MKAVLTERGARVYRSTCVLLALGIVASATISLSSRSESEDFPGSLIGNPKTLRAVYARWRDAFVRSGSAGKLLLPLRHIKGISSTFSRASGRAIVDLEDGTLDIEVYDLPETSGQDAWFVDNLPGRGQSVRAEKNDRMIRVGALHRVGNKATLEAKLNPADLLGFQLDLLMVVPSGRSPVDAGWVSGSPSLFQRLFFSEQRGLPFGRLIPVPAFASQSAGGLDTLDELVASGEDLFVNETFNGNGRTCATCHPPANNFTIDPTFIAARPSNDPLFVAEQVPELSDLEDSTKLRQFGLIKVNNDGFSQPAVFRAVQHTLAMSTSLASSAAQPQLQATGWSGDGAPGSGTLRDFPIGAIVQHAPRTLNRMPDLDFRLPTDEELDAMEAFTLSLGRSEEFDLESMEMLDSLAEAGRVLFLTSDSNGGQQRAGKCNVCHRNAGALSLLNPGVNDNFDTGVENFIHPAGTLPRDRGRGVCSPGNAAPCGDGTFNTPPLIEVADTGAFFHNNQSTTLRNAIQFYSTDAFQDSPAGRLLASMDSGGVVIDITNTGGAQIEAFLTVLNSLENIRSALAYQETARSKPFPSAQLPMSLALAELDDALQVLIDQRLHADAQSRLQNAHTLVQAAMAIENDEVRASLLTQARGEERTAGGLMVSIRTRIESIADEDGVVRETNETSGIGVLVSSSTPVNTVGDDVVDRQMKIVLSFDTSNLPDYVAVTEATLELTNAGIIGPNPFGALGSLSVDVNNGSFGANALEPGDFDAPATAPGVGAIDAVGNSGTITAVQLSGALSHFNVSGRTQLRLAFSLDDNDNSRVDAAAFFSSNFSDALRHPQLRLRLGGSEGHPPSFSSDPINKPNARATEVYSGSVAGDAVDPDASDILTFARISGPAWLAVGNGGILSGTPGSSDVGANSWIIEVGDNHGGTDRASLSITVDPQPTGQTTRAFESVAAEDGWIQESGEDTSVGRTASAGGATLNVGDDTFDRQFVIILSFDTTSIPDSATLLNATLELTRAGTVGQDPFARLGPLSVDLQNGTYGSAALEASDFQALAGAAGVVSILNQGGTGVVFSADLTGGLGQVNKGGRTQVRLRFSTPDNDDNLNNIAVFFSSNNSSAVTHPRLIITFE